MIFFCNIQVPFFPPVAFEEQASNEAKIERHIAPGEAKFLMELIRDHGTTYKVSFAQN